MTEPKRWLDSADAPLIATELLAAARPPRPLDVVTKARSRRRLAAITAIPAAASVMFWIKSVALGAVLGSVVTASVVAIKTHVSETPSAQPTPAAPKYKRERHIAPTQEARAIEPEAVPSVAPSAALSVNVNSGGTATTRVAPTPSDVANRSLEREIQLLERARQLMNVNPTLALSTLDQHRREFGSGTLVLERQFLEVEALLRLGRRDQALARAADLRARAPGSLYERRLSQILGSE